MVTALKGDEICKDEKMGIEWGRLMGLRLAEEK
jgi:hypothetical protein